MVELQAILSPSQYERHQKIISFRNYYQGNFRKWMIPKILPNQASIDDNVKVALARKVVNKGNYFLFGKGLRWSIDDELKETALFSIWGNQEYQNSFLSEVGINGAVTGNFAIQIVNRPDRIYLKNLDPAWVFPELDDDEQFKSFSLPFYQNKELYRIWHYKDTHWYFVKQKRVYGEWSNISPVELWPFDWPFIVYGKNLPNPNSMYGQSDLEDADINDYINLVASNVNRTVRIFSHPIIWSKGFTGAGLNFDVSKAINTTSEYADMQALQLTENISGSLDFFNTLRSLFAEVTNVPESNPELLKIGSQSGFSLEVLFNDLVLKTGIKQSFYGQAIIELNARLLELSGYGKDNQTKLQWPNPLPVDTQQQINGLGFDLANGLISKKTASTIRGYDYESEVDLIREQSDSNLLAESIVTAFRNSA